MVGVCGWLRNAKYAPAIVAAKVKTAAAVFM
jgi:hypothetical protein